MKKGLFKAFLTQDDTFWKLLTTLIAQLSFKSEPQNFINLKIRYTSPLVISHVKIICIYCFNRWRLVSKVNTYRIRLPSSKNPCKDTFKNLELHGCFLTKFTIIVNNCQIHFILPLAFILWCRLSTFLPRKKVN